jgi:hypothetical protein
VTAATAVAETDISVLVSIGDRVPPSAEKPNSLGSWPTITVRATPLR